MTAVIRAVPVKVLLDYDCVGALRWVPATPLGHLAGDRIGGVSELADR